MKTVACNFLLILTAITAGLLLLYFGLPPAEKIVLTKQKTNPTPLETNSAVLNQNGGLKIDKTIADFNLTFLDGSQKQILDYSQNIIILQFFTQNCPSCLQQIKELSALKQTAQKANFPVVIFLIYLMNQKESAPDYSTLPATSLPILTDRGHLYNSLIGQQQSPLTRLIIDKNDKLRFKDFRFETASQIYQKIIPYL